MSTAALKIEKRKRNRTSINDPGIIGLWLLVIITMLVAFLFLSSIFREHSIRKETAPFCEEIHERINASSDLDGNPFVIQGDIVYNISRSDRTKSMFLNEIIKRSYMVEGADFVNIDNEIWFSQESLHAALTKPSIRHGVVHRVLACLNQPKC